MHQHYGERCLYFVLRVRDLQVTNTAEVIDALMGEARVGTYSVYLLYGVYDVLIRTWLTATARDRLEALLDTRVGIIADWEEFQVEHIRYLWAGDYVALTSRVIETHRQNIETVARFTGTPETAAQLLTTAEALLDARILHVLLSRSPDTIKHYVALQSQHGGSSRTRAVDDLVKRLRAAGLETVSLYSGVGFATHLIKSVVNAFPDVLRRLNLIAPIASTYNMRTTSMLIATSHVAESDVLLTNTNLANPLLAQIIGVIGSQYELRLIDLPDDDQNNITSVFRKYSSLLGTACDRLFISLLRSLLDETLDDLSRELSLLMHFEHVLKEYFRDYISGSMGNQAAAKALAEAAKQMPKYRTEVGDDPSIDHLALGTTAQLLNHLVRNGLLDEPAIIQQKLGPAWAAVIEQFTKTVRNPLAHGTIFTADYRRRFLNHWQDNSRLICQICLLYTHLVDTSEET